MLAALSTKRLTQVITFARNLQKQNSVLLQTQITYKGYIPSENYLKMAWFDERPFIVPTAKSDGKKGKPDKKDRADKRQKAQVITQPDPSDPLGAHYGDSKLIQSRNDVPAQTITRVDALTAALAGQSVTVRGRAHAVRGKGNSAFVIIRQQVSTVQCVLFANGETVSKVMVKYASQIPRESIVDVAGIVVAPKVPVEACSQKDVELQVTDVHVVSRAEPLPFDLADACRPEDQTTNEQGQELVRVNQDTRLDMRYLDLRTPANQAIFKVQSGVCQLFRSTLLSQNFMEIHTPKLIAGASEGGSAVFKLQYTNGAPACLAQSPQLYKQMAICADFQRVFEIGPVFRAEHSYTHRHMCEFTGLDLEMQITQHYSEVLDVLEMLFESIFKGLETEYGEQLKVIGAQYPFEAFQYKPCRIAFKDGVKMLRDAGHEIGELDDLTTALERALGQIIKKKHNTDFFILYDFPLAIRPFYTMPSPHDPNYSNSFDVFMRGEEIISGAQRVHDAQLLCERADACEVPQSSIQAYIDAFKLGAPPHGGAGVGLERVVMLYCGLNNIRKTSMFPRDPKRLTP